MIPPDSKLSAVLVEMKKKIPIGPDPEERTRIVSDVIVPHPHTNFESLHCRSASKTAVPWGERRN
jgi:hypothetical protein